MQGLSNITVIGRTLTEAVEGSAINLISTTFRETPCNCLNSEVTINYQ